MFSIARRDVGLKCAILCDLGFLACYIQRNKEQMAFYINLFQVVGIELVD